ncbi:MAG: pyruvate formate lyase-activating protein [Clostridia bacterium]|nr:pyruvate formate lyase-activating protein [Clostridia bacterium]
MEGYIHSVETFGAVDGPGLRYVVFFQGCPLRCLYCHNPDSWKMAEGEKKTDTELLSDILEYKSFIKRGGVTFSGGEPLAQPTFLLSLIRKCKKHGLHTAIDTAGSIPLEISRSIISEADMLLLDIKTLDEALYPELTGQTIHNNLETLDFCEEIGKPVWIRHVLVPGYTLVEERMKKLAAYLKKYSCIQKVELLPFHKLGEYKWEQLGHPYKLLDVPVPTEEEMALAKKIFEVE